MESVGLIAGNGQFPILFADAAKKRGVRVIAVAMRGETEPTVADAVDEITWVRVGQLGKMIRAFKRAGVKQAAMAGGVRKTRLFEGARPDWRGIQLLTRYALRPDDGMLRAVASEFERSGIIIIDSTLFLPEILAPQGVLTRTQPSERQWQDLRYGQKIAFDMGKLDIGQAVVVKDGAVVALEAIEGTDACIHRAGELTKPKGGAVPIASRFDDPYFSLEDGLAETGHVFLAGNGLPERFRDGFQVAELGFGTGLNFLATWAAWSAADVPGTLRFTSFELYPLEAEDMVRALSVFPDVAVLAGPLLDARRAGQFVFEAPGVQLEIIVGDARREVAAWAGSADAWFLDGFAPARNPELWEPDLLAQVARHTSLGGTAATYSAAGAVRRALADAGFTVERCPGYGRKRHMTVARIPGDAI